MKKIVYKSNYRYYIYNYGEADKGYFRNTIFDEARKLELSPGEKK